VITAVDTSILLDVFGGDRTFGPESSRLLRQALAEGKVIGCSVVWAEVACFFPTPEDARSAMATLAIDYDPIPLEAALQAGQVWQRYRQAGGSRTRMIPDFLIATHAHYRAERLLTRDRGFYRSYFVDLRLLSSDR
jgi:predicted nucleic acid-binding protein